MLGFWEPKRSLDVGLTAFEANKANPIFLLLRFAFSFLSIDFDFV